MKPSSFFGLFLLTAAPMFGAGCYVMPYDGDMGMGMTRPAVSYRPRLTVSVQRSTAAGTVTSLPTGIACAPDCWGEYDTNTVVSLTATPREGWVFDRWEGDCAGNAPAVSVTLDYSKVCDAIFKPAGTAVPVEDNVDGGANAPNGNVALDPVGVCCAPAGSEASYLLCEEGGAKCCSPITALQCKSSGGKWMSADACHAAGPTC